MTFSKKKLPKSQVEIEVEVSVEELDSYKEKAIGTLGQNLRVEGFRPGHVPAEIVIRELGQEKILTKAAELAVRESWLKILKEEQLEVIGEPEIQILKLALGNPLLFRVRAAVLPEIELPDYKDVAFKTERRQVQVQEQELEDALDWLRESRKQEDGTVPEASDEFARSLGQFENLSALKQSLKQGLLHEKETRESERLRQEILEKIAGQAKGEIADLLVARERLAMMENLKKGVGDAFQMNFEDYLKKIEKSEQELFDSFGTEAEQRVKRYLVLREVSERESIEATPEEIEEETGRILQHYKNMKTAARDIDPKRLKEYTEGVIRHEKTLRFLESFVQHPIRKV